MCGIAGIIQSDPSRYNTEHIRKMTGALAHRGPDGDGHWQNPGQHVLLGHRRLSIIDLSDAAAQPMQYLDRYSIIHNGEIYNHVELREELAKSGYAFKSKSDTEVMAAAYDHWGENCVDHFDGMFAFAIWDEAEQDLFAARDRFGEKPFFYFFNGTDFIFASEMKALWEAGVERTPNLQMLFNFITIGYTGNPERPGETFYESISKLPAASRLYYERNNGQLTVEPYWNLNPGITQKTITDAEAMEQFTHLLSVSIKRRLRSDVPAGSSLSGGIDSSAVAALASMFLKGPAGSPPFRAFTAIFPGFEKDESAYAKQVTRQFGLQQHTITAGVHDLMKDWEKLCYHQEEPFGSASVYAQYKVYEMAGHHGVKVLLDGQGADEILAGYPRYYKWYWQELFIRRKLMRSGELKAARKLGNREQFGLKNVVAALLPDLASVILERRYLLKALGQEDLHPEFVQQQSREAYYTTPEYFNLNGALYFNCCTHGLEELLRYADRNAMAHGCEPRLPFLNHDLVEFVFSLPSHFKIRDGWTKWLLRNAMDQVLPSSITWRTDKTGFEPPQLLWMQSPELKDAVQEARKKLVDEKILSPGILQKPIRPQASHEADNYDWRYLAAAPFL